jgi:hypothetical protein
MNKRCVVHNSKMGRRLGKKKADASGSRSCPVADCGNNGVQMFGSNSTKLSTVSTKEASKLLDSNSVTLAYGTSCPIVNL